MIVKFSVENYLSFKEKATIDFQAGSIKEYRENTFSPFPKCSVNLLKSIGILGNNASGKSNFIKGLTLMKEFVLNSSRESNSSQDIPIIPFLLSTETELNPSTFEIIFFLNEVKYRYGFSATSKVVESEWLFYTQKNKEEMLFVRAKQNYNFDKHFKSATKSKIELFVEVTRANSLFLSVLSQFNNQLCQSISNWFNELIIAHDTAHSNLIESTARLMSTSDYRLLINEIMKKSDLGIENVEEELKESSSFQSSFYDFVLNSTFEQERRFNVKVSHNKYSKGDTIASRVYFDLFQNESLGTQKFFGILGPILYALKQGKSIWIDEIDARMHSLLFERLINLFNSSKYNPNGAQLVFTAHNTHILKKGLRRDQMAFVKKNEFGASSLGSLYDKSPKTRNDASFDKDYLLGKYGGIPVLGSQLNLFSDGLD